MTKEDNQFIYAISRINSISEQSKFLFNNTFFLNAIHPDFTPISINDKTSKTLLEKHFYACNHQFNASDTMSPNIHAAKSGTITTVYDTIDPSRFAVIGTEDFSFINQSVITTNPALALHMPNIPNMIFSGYENQITDEISKSEEFSLLNNPLHGDHFLLLKIYLDFIKSFKIEFNKKAVSYGSLSIFHRAMLGLPPTKSEMKKVANTINSMMRDEALYQLNKHKSNTTSSKFKNLLSLKQAVIQRAEIS